MIGSITRCIFGLISMAGLLTCIWGYERTFHTAPMAMMSLSALALVLGLIVLMALIVALEYPASLTKKFGPDLLANSPAWASLGAKLLGFVAALHLIVFFSQTGFADPSVRDGEYVLYAHGRIAKVINEEEYVALKHLQERMFAALLAFFYFTIMTYWLFRKDPNTRSM